MLQSYSWSSLVHMPSQSFTIGEAVQVRDKLYSSWLSGTVTSLSPLEVQVQGWPFSMTYAFIRPKQLQKPKLAHVVASKKDKPVHRKMRLYPADVPHVVGAGGKMINNIRETTQAKMILTQQGQAQVALLKIHGTPTQVQAAMIAVRKAIQDVHSFVRRLQRRRRARNSRRCFTNSTEPWAKDQWYLQKEQHGTNGDWRRRKFKNKGRKQPKKRKESKKCIRKPNRKQVITLSSRRLSY